MIEIREEAATAESIAEYCSIPMEFRIETRYNPKLLVGSAETWRLEEEAVEPYLKNYDEVDNPDEWASRFDLTKWTMFSAFGKCNRMGGCIMAWNTPGVDM